MSMYGCSAVDTGQIYQLLNVLSIICHKRKYEKYINLEYIKLNIYHRSKSSTIVTVYCLTLLKVCSHLTSFSPFLFSIVSMVTASKMGRMGCNPFCPFFINTVLNINWAVLIKQAKRR